MADLKDQHAAITGGGSGIGLAIAAKLAGAGAQVTLMSRNLDRLSSAAATIDGAKVVSVDVTDDDSVVAGFESAVRESGPVTILVNNAGGVETAPFGKITPEAWRRALDLNLTGAFRCTQAVLPAMQAGGAGRIINIASTAGLKGYAYTAAYVAAKHGLVGLTRALATELATNGITVNALCPGFTDTDIVSDAVAIVTARTGRSADDVLAEFAGFNPQGRLILPEEVADAAVWLASDGARSVTGQAIAIAGGEIM